MSTEREQLQAVIDGLEAQRGLLGDAIVDAGLEPLRAKLAGLGGPDRDPPLAAQNLRQVTVLFLDVVDSTALAQHLDPEDIHAVMDGALARCTAIVETNGGKVLQYAGDSLLAVFGADVAHEDDPERAVLAGLALLDEGRRQAEWVKRRHDYGGFDIRVGVHTGGVLLGGGVDADASIRGVAVNIAARMEQTAPPGGMRISHDTYSRVRGVFDVEPQPPIQVKGLDAPIVTYLVERVRPRALRAATRGIEGLQTRMVGRDAELARLQRAFLSVASECRSSAVMVDADAGVGKSRLLHEFERWTATRSERCTLLQARADAQMPSRPYGLLREIVADWLQMADSDATEVAREKLERGMVPLFEPDEGADLAHAQAHLLGHLIGLDFSTSPHVAGILGDGRQIRQRGFHAAAQLLRRIADREPGVVLLLLDDLHWADEQSLDFLDHLGVANRDVPMLVLAGTRSALFERRADVLQCSGVLQRMTLAPLDSLHSDELAGMLLQKVEHVPTAVRELLARGAEGNPFYMEELVKMLIDRGAIETGPQPWRLKPDKLDLAQVPPTLTGVLQARLDSLTPAEKRALQQASVIGAVFWDQALAAVDDRAADALPALVRRDLIVAHDDSIFPGMREYAFRHHLLQQVAYDTLLKRSRREVHAKVAAWLADSSGARADTQLGVTAEHFTQAGDARNALEYFARAAEHAATRFAHEALIGFVAKALALAADDDAATRWRLLVLREREFDVHGLRTEQAADVAALHALAEALDDDQRRAEVDFRRSNLAFRTGDYPTAQAAATRALELARRSGARSVGLMAQHMLAAALSITGDTAAAEALGRQGLAAARAQGDLPQEARFVNILSVIASRQDDLFAAHELDKELLQICRKSGNRRDEAVALANLGLGLVGFGDFAQAQIHLGESLRLARSVGARFVEPHALRHLAALALQVGEPEVALAHARAALELAIEGQDRLSRAVSLLSSAEAELALGRHDAAASAFEQTHRLCVELEHPIALDALAGLMCASQARGDAAQALQHAQSLLDALARRASLAGTDSPLLIQLRCFDVLDRAGDPRAAALLAGAHADLHTQAARISDAALRRCFLENIPEHREVEAAWSAGRASARDRSAGP